MPKNCVWDEGQSLIFRLEFNEPVIVSGAPRLKLKVGSNEVYADYVEESGVQTEQTDENSRVSFRHKITAGETDFNGIEVDSSLDLNGGSILYADLEVPRLDFSIPDLSLLKINPVPNEELRGRWKLDEGSLGTVIDYGPYSLATSISGSPTWTTESSSHYLVFNGLDSFLNIGNPVEVRPADGLTVSAWARVNAEANMLVSHGNWNNYHLLYDRGQITAYLRNPSATLTTDETIPEGEWFHVAMTYDKETFGLYVNGTLKKSVSISGSLQYGGLDPGLRIGSYSSYGSLWAPSDGSLRDVRIYGKAVSADLIGSMACGL